MTFSDALFFIWHNALEILPDCHVYQSVVSSSSPFIAEEYSMVWMYHSLLNLLRDILVVSSFWLLQIKLSCIFVYKFLYRHKFLLLWGKCPGVQLLGCMINECLRVCSDVSLWF